jgi:hypothetical protein
VAARTLALGVDYTAVFDKDEEDLLIHQKILHKAEEMVLARRRAELEDLIIGVGHQVVSRIF